MKTCVFLIYIFFHFDFSHGLGNVGPQISKALSSLWLNDLLENYQTAFPRQFGFGKINNNSMNSNKWRHAVGICQNVSFLNVEQNNRIINKHGWDKTLNETIHKMIDNPRARLFRYFNLQGKFEDYHFSKNERNGMCTELKLLNKSVDSVFTFGKCIRLFEKESCKGWSRAIYPGSSHSNKLSGKEPITFRSIGPCFENEFSAGSFNHTVPLFVLKNPELKCFSPDLAIIVPDFDKSKGVKVFNAINFQIVLGPNNRTESIRAVFPDERFNQSHPQRGELDDFRKLLDKDGNDIVGYAIPPKFGGPTTQAFNVFPASKESIIEWDQVLARLFKGAGVHELVLNFEYDNKNTSRPIFFYYLFTNPKGEIHYGRIINGNSSERRDQPYVQAIAKTKGTAGINLTQIYENFRNESELMNPSNNFIRSFNHRNAIISEKNVLTCQRVNSIYPEVQEPFNRPRLFEAMIQKPMVRLFTGENLTGEHEDYHSGIRVGEDKPEGCYDIKKVMKAKSAATFDKCIRLFENEECRGVSLAIYKGSEYSGRITDSGLTQVESVGPCLSDEFMNASFSGKAKSEVVKDRESKNYIPDLLLHGFFSQLLAGHSGHKRYFYEDKFKSVPEFWRNWSIFVETIGLGVQYSLDNYGRIEQIHGRIGRPGLIEMKENKHMEKSDFYKRLDNKDADFPCYAIPLAIGGPANESFNVFSTSQSRCEDWAQKFPVKFSDQNVFVFFLFSFYFVYDGDENNRPLFIYYHFGDTLNFRIYYGRFVN